MRMDIWGISDIGNVRKVNQDRISICRDEGTALLTVADGMGGMDSGEKASGMFAEGMEEWWGKNSGRLKDMDTEDMEDAVYDIFFDINKKIYDFCISEGIKTGTTGSILLVNGDKAIIAYSGDTRIYRIGEWDGAELLSEDDNLYSYIEKSPDEEENFEKYKNVMLAYVGKSGNISVSMKNIVISPGDIFIIATDGFYNYFNIQSDENIMMAKAMEAKEFAEEAVKKTKQTRAADNLSLIIAKFQEEL
ncbi:MAG: serine/threonine-protein phosphatase [Clostridiales bacterium]|nr:serine/threonine-protein phosphatase [Clostridiales bacterium]